MYKTKSIKRVIFEWYDINGKSGHFMANDKYCIYDSNSMKFHHCEVAVDYIQFRVYEDEYE